MRTPIATPLALALLLLCALASPVNAQERRTTVDQSDPFGYLSADVDARLLLGGSPTPLSFIPRMELAGDFRKLPNFGAFANMQIRSGDTWLMLGPSFWGKDWLQFGFGAGLYSGPEGIYDLRTTLRIRLDSERLDAYALVDYTGITGWSYEALALVHLGEWRRLSLGAMSWDGYTGPRAQWTFFLYNPGRKRSGLTLWVSPVMWNMQLDPAYSRFYSMVGLTLHYEDFTGSTRPLMAR